MQIKEIYKKHKRTFSFEFYPPKSNSSFLELGINVGQLLKLDPSFISVTYGAGGSNQDASFELIDYLQNKLGLVAMAHYTCVNASKEKVASDLEHLHKINIANLMLLRGDTPKGFSAFPKENTDFHFASELVKYAKSLNKFTIGVAGYPELHPESPDQDSDIRYLQEKLKMGGDFVVTQMFFDNSYYYSFVKKAREAGITARIIPGIIPITNFKQIKRFSKMSNSVIPEEISEKLEPYQDDPEKTYELGVDIAIRQCIDLLENGAPGIHFYTLNKSRATVDIFSSLPHYLKKLS